MSKRKMRVVSDSPLLCLCEGCSSTFKCSSRDYEQAAREVKAQFEDHECKPQERGQNAEPRP
jgi:hypothetical protein